MKFFNTTKINFSKDKIYAVHKGTYLGHLLLYVEYDSLSEQHCFISIKNLSNINVPVKDAIEGLTTGLLRETNIKLPGKFRTLCLKQYNYNIENTTKQFNIKEDEESNS